MAACARLWRDWCDAMRVLIWQWGRRGAMPRFAWELARGCAAVPGAVALLSLAQHAEIMPVPVAFSLATYHGPISCVLRLVLWPLLLVRLLAALHRVRPDIAIGVHAGPLDPVMALALRLYRIPFRLIVHDATTHPGDRPSVMLAQNATLALSAGAIVLCSHVEALLRAQGFARPILRSQHPPFAFACQPPPPPRAHKGPLRVLCFGRLQSYKGLNLLADAAQQLGPHADMVLRVVGQGAECADLARLRAVAWVTVENRWVPEAELGAVFAWADAVVLPYTEASQSGVAAAAMASGRHLIATDVGGLAEQCGQYPHVRLCEPSGAALARALCALRDTPDTNPPCCAADTEIDWREMAACLIAAI